MNISKERFDELGLGRSKEACLDCMFCYDCYEVRVDVEDSILLTKIENAIENNEECPSLDEERLREEITEEEYDAWRHNRLNLDENTMTVFD